MCVCAHLYVVDFGFYFEIHLQVDLHPPLFVTFCQKGEISFEDNNISHTNILYNN